MKSIRKFLGHGTRSLFVVLVAVAVIQAATSYFEVPGSGLWFRTTDPEVNFVGNMTFKKIGNANGNVNLNSQGTGAFRLNTRDYSSATSNALGISSKPNQTVAGVSIQGLEVQPRFASGIGGVNLIGANISAITKGTTGNLSGEVHVLELETDFDQSLNPTRTITGDVTLLRFSGGFPNSMTFSGKKTAMQVAPAQNGPYDGFIKFDTTNTDIVLDAGTGDNSCATSNGFTTNPAGWKAIKILLGGTAYYLCAAASNAN